MGQVTLYLDDELERLMQQAAESAGKSRSRWVAEVIEARLVDRWPADFERLCGAWAGDSSIPDAGELRRGHVPDVERETL